MMRNMPSQAEYERIASISGRAFFRAASGALLGYVGRTSPLEIVKQRWPSDQDAQVLAKAAMVPTSTANTGALVQAVVAEGIASLAPQSAGAAILRRGLELQLGQAGAIVVPTVLAQATDFAFIAEG